MGQKYSDIISHLLAVLPLSSHRKRSPGNNLIICFCKIRRSIPYQVDCEQSLTFLLNHSNFTFSLVARSPLAINLPGAIKYIDHARKLRAQCEVYSTNLGSQFKGSAQSPYRQIRRQIRRTDSRRIRVPLPRASRFYLVNAK